MARTWVEPEGPPDPRLDPYRRGIARVYDDKTLVGYFATRVDVMRTVEGPFWRRREVRPVELPEWVLRPASSERREAVAHFCDDGIVIPEELESQLRDWGDGRLRRGGDVLRLEWMSGEDAHAAWQRSAPDWW